MVAYEFISKRVIRLWQDDFGPQPPFSTDDSTLFITYMASAEWGCFLTLGWPLPTRIVDLYIEFRNETNGIVLSGKPIKRSLLSALAYHHLTSITKEEKDVMRALVLRGGPWTSEERQQILDYCQSDVDCLEPLFERMLPGIQYRRNGFTQALFRARFTTAAARMERIGTPIDVETLEQFRTYWPDIKLELIKAVDKDFGVFEGTTFKGGRFAEYLVSNNITDWPRTATGQLGRDKERLDDMAEVYPQISPLKDLLYILNNLRVEKLAVGPDNRNRVMLSYFGAKTGRNTPKASQYIFGPSVWLRGLIKPTEGRALAYIDWKSQEVHIAAALSGDQALLDTVATGDPYLTFAKMAGLAPPDATKQTHGAVRALCKTCVLGSNYGLGTRSLAMKTQLHVIEAESLHRKLELAFPVYAEWIQSVIYTGQLTRHLSTKFGWTLRTSGARPNSLRNFLMQAHGAEMLRLACNLATEQGIHVCAPVHDALLIEAAADEIDDAVAVTRAAMSEASGAVLDGIQVATDVETVVWPDRYADPRGQEMWSMVTEIASRLADQ